MSSNLKIYRNARFILLLLGCVGIVILGCLGLNGYTWHRLNENGKDQALDLELLSQYSLVRSTLQSVKLGHYGYLLTSDAEHLQVFREAEDKFVEEWKALVALERLRGTSELSLKTLETVSKGLIDHVSKIVTLKMEGNLNSEGELPGWGHERSMVQVLEPYRERVAFLENAIKQRNQRTRNDFRSGLFTSVIMGMFGLSVGCLALVLLQRVLKEMRRSERYALNMLKSEESRRQKDIFLAMMSHEIRTPLNAIIGFGQLAQQEKLNTRASRYLTSMLDGGQSLLLLINDILDLSRLQAGRIKLNIRSANLRETFGFLERLYKESCEAKGIRFDLTIQENIPHFLLVDSSRLRQIFTNLIGNAIRATSIGGIHLELSGVPNPRQRENWDLTFRVSDSGCGIAEEDLEHLFEPFYHSANPKVDSDKSTGLGLSIVHRFVQLMNGTIAVESEEDKGTVFTILLSNVEVGTGSAVADALEVQPLRFSKIPAAHILAVDDNEINLQLIKELFSDTHHTISFAENGEVAVEKAAIEMPDIILMDMRMPVMDGATAAAKIKAQPRGKDIQILSITAGDVGLSERSEDGSLFDGTIRKPFSRKEMFDAVSKLLKRRKISEEKPEINQSQNVRLEAPAELISALDTMKIERWSSVSAEMSLSDVMVFCEELEDLEDKFQNEILQHYCHRLRTEVESLSFIKMEHILMSFPDMLDDLKRK